MINVGNRGNYQPRNTEGSGKNLVLILAVGDQQLCTAVFEDVLKF